jgi:hypothetical protein
MSEDDIIDRMTHAEKRSYVLLATADVSPLHVYTEHGVNGVGAYGWRAALTAARGRARARLLVGPAGRALAATEDRVRLELGRGRAVALLTLFSFLWRRWGGLVGEPKPCQGRVTGAGAVRNPLPALLDRQIISVSKSDISRIELAGERPYK